MISSIYGINCLRYGFERYKRYCKLPISIEVSKTTVSFYAKKVSDNTNGQNARISHHHPRLQHYVDNGREPWQYDNISIEFIAPHSKEDTEPYRARVYQNPSGTIKPFDITTYQYNSEKIEPTDIPIIFRAVVLFFNGKGYSDPFASTEKQALVIPRHSNIKPCRAKPLTESISNVANLYEVADKCIEGYLQITTENNIQENSQIKLDYNYIYQSNLKEHTIYNKNNYIKENNIMKRTIKLNEAELHDIIRESVYTVLNEEELEEGFFGDKWNQLKSAYNTVTQGGGPDGMSLGDRFSAAKKNWSTQGELNGLNNLMQQLSQFVDAGQLNPNMTIAQLIGGKYNNNKFGKMTGMAANRKAQIRRRGGTFY